GVGAARHAPPATHGIDWGGGGAPPRLRGGWGGGGRGGARPPPAAPEAAGEQDRDRRHVGGAPLVRLVDLVSPDRLDRVAHAGRDRPVALQADRRRDEEGLVRDVLEGRAGVDTGDGRIHPVGEAL